MTGFSRTEPYKYDGAELDMRYGHHDYGNDFTSAFKARAAVVAAGFSLTVPSI